MDKNVLNRYFEKRSSKEEIKIVEEWLLDPNNQTKFELFLEKRWQDHLLQDKKNTIVGIKKSFKNALWKVAAAFLLVFGGFHLFTKKDASPRENQLTATWSPEDNLVPEPSSKPLLDTSDDITNPKNSIHHERKTTNASKAKSILAVTDTLVQKKKSQGVKASKLGNFMVNEVLLSKLRHKIDSNQLVLTIDLNEATIGEIAYRLRKNYGIILEPCSSETTSKTYTARFEEISINDLLYDMSQKMLFSYTVQDSIIKVCFN